MAAEAMGIGSHNTAQEYVRSLAEAFVLMTLYFVAPSRSARDKTERIPVEVKGDAAGELKGAAISIQRSFGRGIIATRGVFNLDADVPRIPVAVLLAALDERTERRLSVL